MNNHRGVSLRVLSKVTALSIEKINERSTAGLDPRVLRDLAPLDGRPLTVLIDTTNTCNLRCRMCYFSFDEVFRRRPIHMSTQDFERLAAQLFPLAKMVVLSAGSEPLVHAHFDELIAITARHEPPHVRFLTNAQLLDAHIAEACVRHGVTELHVSTDGATRETYEWVRRGGKFDRLVSNLRRLKEIKRAHHSAKPLVQFNVTLMRRNIGELGAFARLALELGVEQIACRHLMPYDGLNIESEALSKDPQWANEQLARGMMEIREAGVRLVMFPDYFGEDAGSVNTPPWSDVTQAPETFAVGAELRLATSFGTQAVISWNAQTQFNSKDQLRDRSVAKARSTASSSPASIEENRPSVPISSIGDRMSIGRIDEPSANPITARDGQLLSGWALSSNGVVRITMVIEPKKGEMEFGSSPRNWRTIGQAVQHNGSRPDVMALYRDWPQVERCGWTFRLRQADLPADGFPRTLHVLAWDVDETLGCVDSRTLVKDDGAIDQSNLYCRKPFSSVYVDSAGNVYPYPDCQTVEPFGNLLRGEDFESIWFGSAFTELRRLVAAVNPPAMCRACPDFINRHPDDPDYFAARRVLPMYRLPQGFIDLPKDGVLRDDSGTTELQLAGWASGFAPVDSIVIQRRDFDDNNSPRGTALDWLTTNTGLARPDVACVHRAFPAAASSGWSLGLPVDQFSRHDAKMELRVRAVSREGISVEIGAIQIGRVEQGWSIRRIS